MGNIIPICLAWIFFVGFYIERCEGEPNLKKDGSYTLIGEKKTLTCESSANITDSVAFYANPGNLLQGSCLPSGTCGSSVSGYSVTQDRSMRTTTLQILSFDQLRDLHMWYCQDGIKASPQIDISPIAKIPDARFQVSPKPSLNAGDNFTVTVEFVGYYCSENVTFIMKLANSNEYDLTGAPTDSSTLLSGNATSSSIKAQAEMSGNISLVLGCGVPITIPINAVVLTVTVPSTVCDEHDGRIIAIVVGVVSPSLAAIVGYIVYRISRKEADAVLAAGICLIAVGFSCLVAILVVCTNVSGTSAPIALSLSIIMIIGGIILIITSKMGCWKRCGKGNIGANDEPKDSGQPVGSVPLENGKPENGSPDNASPRTIVSHPTYEGRPLPQPQQPVPVARILPSRNTRLDPIEYGIENTNNLQLITEEQPHEGKKERKKKKKKKKKKKGGLGNAKVGHSDTEN